MLLSEQEMDDLIAGIYSGLITEMNLPVNLYFAIADRLKEGVYKGFGIDFNELKDKAVNGFKFDLKDLELLTELRENTYMFSAAKTFNEVLDFRGVMVNGDGEIKPFKEFKQDMLSLDEQYNKNWLRTEYDTAYGQAQNSVAWNQFEKNKDVLPNLKYSAVIDANTSDICAPLDGICLPIDNPFWDKFMPLNHFNCRCLVTQEDADVTLTSGEDVKELTKGSLKEMDDVFKMNSGKQGVVFSEKHPYFEVENKYKKYASNNFNLPIPNED